MQLWVNISVSCWWSNAKTSPYFFLFPPFLFYVLQRLNSISPSSRIHPKVETSPSRHKVNNRNDVRSPKSVSPSKGGRCSSDDKHRRDVRSASSDRHHARSRGRTRIHKETSVNSGSHSSYSSDSEGSVLPHTTGLKKLCCCCQKVRS